MTGIKEIRFKAWFEKLLWFGNRTILSHAILILAQVSRMCTISKQLNFKLFH